MKKILTILVLFLAFIFLGMTEAQAAPPASIKVYVQWARANPLDWDLIDASVWSSQPTKADPIGDVSLAGIGIGDSLLNNAKGYIFSINVQGLIFNWYDHYAIGSTSDSIIVTAWRDDPILFPVGIRQADVGTFKPLAFDQRVNQNNTVQSFILYREGTEYNNLVGNLPENTTLQNYSTFVPPASVETKPGIYLSDAKWAEHIVAQTLHGWR